MLEGASGDCLVQPPCRKQGQLKACLREQVAQYLIQFIFSLPKGRNSTIALGNLLHCSIVLEVEKLFLFPKWSFLYFSLCPSHASVRGLGLVFSLC